MGSGMGKVELRPDERRTSTWTLDRPELADQYDLGLWLRFIAKAEYCDHKSVANFGADVQSNFTVDPCRIRHGIPYNNSAETRLPTVSSEP